MNITITGRKVNVRDSFKERVEKKLGKLDKFFNDDAECHVTVTVEKNYQTVEATINTQGMYIRAEESADTMEEALDRVVDVLVRQVRKNKTKLAKRLRPAAVELSELKLTEQEKEETASFNIIRNKKFAIKPMDVQEAILQMNMLGHNFYMFRNAETGEINVVYLRKNNSYGLIEPEDEI